MTGQIDVRITLEHGLASSTTTTATVSVRRGRTATVTFDLRTAE